MRFSKFMVKLITFFLLVFIISPISSAIALAESPGSEITAEQPSKTSLNSSQDKILDSVVTNRESTLTAPVTDPNFNVMRKSEMLNSKAIFIVVGLLVVAGLVPYLTWLAFR